MNELLAKLKEAHAIALDGDVSELPRLLDEAMGMVEVRASEPAFPTDIEHQSGPSLWHFSGLTKREFYESKALEACVSSWLFADSFHAPEDIPETIERAFKVVDAFMAEQERR